LRIPSGGIDGPESGPGLRIYPPAKEKKSDGRCRKAGDEGTGERREPVIRSFWEWKLVGRELELN